MTYLQDSLFIFLQAKKTALIIKAVSSVTYLQDSLFIFPRAKKNRLDTQGGFFNDRGLVTRSHDSIKLYGHPPLPDAIPRVASQIGPDNTQLIVAAPSA